MLSIRVCWLTLVLVGLNRRLRRRVRESKSSDGFAQRRVIWGIVFCLDAKVRIERELSYPC